MPPCHGGDRRFESGRARQSKCLSRKTGAFALDGFDPGSNPGDAGNSLQIAEFGRQ